MAASAPDVPSTAPRTAILLPIAFLLHFTEEWFGGISEWTHVALGNEISPERLMLINAIAFPLFVVGTLAALHYPRMAWFGTSLAALFCLNGVVHILATLGLARYSPGTLTGLLLYIPLSVVVLRSSSDRLSSTIFARAVWFGVLLHGLVSFFAFL